MILAHEAVSATLAAFHAGVGVGVLLGLALGFGITAWSRRR
ncbi:hypothetical protein [Lysobacter sp. GX 14042]|nr:hypothetical protein [Lysobacter sp. GX 14042]